MHAANRAAWDEAAERYEGWFDEAVDADPGAAARTCFPVEQDLIGDLRGRCRRAIHLQCAGGRDTLSLWNLGADEVVGVDFSPRMLDLARAPDGGDRRPRAWVEADVLDTPHELDGTADLAVHGPRRDPVAPGPRRAGRRCCGGSWRRTGRLVIFDGHPAEWLFDGDGEGGWT